MARRAIVVGGGIVGLSTAWWLRRASWEVALFEQGPLPNPLGASFDRHRLIRYPYGASAGYAAMVGDAYAAWEALWEDLGQRLYAPTGTLVVRRTDDGWASASARTLDALSIPFRASSARECERSYPFLDWDGVKAAFRLESGGVLFADAIVTALVPHLEKLGVELHPDAAVANVDFDRPSVATMTGAQERADAVVVAAGAWVAKLCPRFASRLVPSRQVVAYLAPPPDLADAWAAAPMIMDLDAEPGLYVVPDARGAGLKVGDHGFTRVGDPAAPRGASSAEAAGALEKCRRLFRELDRYRIDSARDCFYTVAPSERFVVEPVGAGWIASACSGHGFKFGPAIGRALADGLTGSRTASDVSAWAAGTKSVNG